MGADREGPTLADYIITAISPVLIMAMLGSLVFFLAEIFYAGAYEGRLLYTLFFFVAGMVLVARISIQSGSAAAWMYGLLLGAAVYAALLAYVNYGKSILAPYAPLVNLFLIALVSWTANKLVWDCTYIDEKQVADGTGLLVAGGFEGPPQSEDSPPAAPPNSLKKKRKRKEKNEPPTEPNWFQRYARYQEQERQKPHTPGLWVLYFAVVALPIFGLGQSLIPPEQVDRRGYVFRLMAIYIGSALGLLLTTSFLGVRRYLRQRGLGMPPETTAMWLGIGTLLIACFLVVGMFLPRPYSETPLFHLSKFSQADRKASKNALLKDSAGKGEGAQGKETTKGDGSGDAKGGKPGQAGKKGESKQGSGEEKGGGSQGPKDGENEGSDAKRGESTGKPKEGEGRKGKDARQQEGENREGIDPQSSPPEVGSSLGKVASIVKWIVFALIALVLFAALAIFVLRGLAPFTGWARRLLEKLSAWWRNLFGGTRNAEEQADRRAAVVRRRSFTEFRNPFDGAAERSAEELVEYSFAALEAWAADFDRERGPEETPLEFADRFGESRPELKESTHRLALLVGRLAYSPNSLPTNTTEIVREFWSVLEVQPTDVADAVVVE